VYRSRAAHVLGAIHRSVKISVRKVLGNDDVEKFGRHGRKGR
jgi:hypothetical protein